MRDSEPEFAREAELKRIEHSYRTNVRFREPMDRLNLEGRIYRWLRDLERETGLALGFGSELLRKMRAVVHPTLEVGGIERKGYPRSGKEPAPSVGLARGPRCRRGRGIAFRGTSMKGCGRSILGATPSEIW